MEVEILEMQDPSMVLIGAYRVLTRYQEGLIKILVKRNGSDLPLNFFKGLIVDSLSPYSARIFFSVNSNLQTSGECCRFTNKRGLYCGGIGFSQVTFISGSKVVFFYVAISLKLFCLAMTSVLVR